MCGINGIYDINLRRESLQDLISKMSEKTFHRGPDNTGIWIDNKIALSNNRLKIIDLSDEANQPFIQDDCEITYNGEIYNYIEIREILKKDGYIFKTQSDTEVILAAYKKWGEQCVNQFVGMWAFAIWNQTKNLLFCARDRFGIKPFYYIHTASGFYFSSEYKSLKTLPIFNKALNFNQVKRGLIFGWACYEDETYYEQIKALPPACNLILKDNEIKIKKYWDLFPIYKVDKWDFKENKERFFELFTDSIKIHSRSDVPLAGSVSGGLDSSAITSMYCNLFPERTYNIFNIYYSGKGSVDERPFVYELIKKYPQIAPRYFSPDETDVLKNLNNAMYYTDIPFVSSSYISHYFLMKSIAKENIRVVLSGQGGDELFAGYLHTFNRLIGKYLRNFRFIRALKLLKAHQDEHNLSSRQALVVLLKSIFSATADEQKIWKYVYKELTPFLNGEEKNNTPINIQKISNCPVTNFFYHLIFTTSLPTILHYEDRNSMAFSVETRVPFLDHRLVEFAFSIPVEQKIHPPTGGTKYILRQSLQEILPVAIADRRDKVPFTTPGETDWLSGHLKHLLDFNYNYFGWLNGNKIRDLITNYKNGDRSNSKLVWRFAMLNYWLNNFN